MHHCAIRSSPRCDQQSHQSVEIAKGIWKYNLLSNNCEDFALHCKTGRMIPSGQVMAIFGVSKILAYLPSTVFNRLR
ncbi:putative LRAT domain-containing protein [Helianthus anomalus]